MKRSLIYFLFAGLLCLNVTGCSLFGSSDDEESAEISQDDEYAKDDFEGGESELTDEVSDGDEGSEEVADAEGEELSDDQFADSDDSGDIDDISELEVEEGAVDEDEFPDDDAVAEVVEDDEFNEDDFAVGDDSDEIPNETLTENEEQDLFAGGEDVEVPTEVYEDTAPALENYVDAPAKTFVSVKKMKPASFQRAGANVNRLYIVRNGDSMSSIAQKIYGSDKSADLYSWNSHFRGKSIKVGDKIYYSSPRSPNDSAMKTYYEDGGVTPQYFSANAGDNLRAIAKKLLGHERSWMEIYATNPQVDTKGIFSTASELRYWQGASVPAQSMAAVEKESPQPQEIEEAIDEPEELEPTEELAEEVGDDPAVEEFEEDTEELSEVAMDPSENPEEDFGDIEDEPEIPAPAVAKVSPPPPPPASKVKAVAPPPPPLPVAKKSGNSLSKFANQVKGKSPSTKMASKNDSKIMGLLGALMLIVGIVVVVFLRRNRSKRVNFTHTQV